MSSEQKQTVYIGCIPVWAHPTHPTDQSPFLVRDCPECKLPMWVSEKKLAHEVLYPNAKTVCLYCLAKQAHEEKWDVELRDLTEVKK